MEDYLKSINPIETDETQGLFYGAKYNCFIEGKSIGIFTWTKDENIGDSFQRLSMLKDKNIMYNEVGVPDYWELLKDNEQ